MKKLQALLKGGRRLLCRLRFHRFDQAELVFEKDRIALACPCGTESSGWVLNQKPPTRRLAGKRQPVGFLFVNGQTFPLLACEFTPAPETIDAFVDEVFAALPTSDEWRGNRDLQ